MIIVIVAFMAVNAAVTFVMLVTVVNMLNVITNTITRLANEVNYLGATLKESPYAGFKCKKCEGPCQGEPRHDCNEP